jgi:hypothetical protein
VVGEAICVEQRRTAMLEAKVLGRNARHVYENTLAQAFYGDFLLLLTLDLQDNVPNDV